MNKRYMLALSLILLAGILFRLWGISSESYWLDEAISIRQAQEKFSTMLELLKGDIHLPLYISMLHVWVRLFGTSEIATRSLSLIFGVLSIPLIYLLAKRLYSDRIALIASAIFAFSPIMVYYSQEVRLYSLFVFLALLSTYLFFEFMQKNNTSSMVLYIMFSALMMYTHLFAFLVILVQNAFILYKRKHKLQTLARWLLSQAILALLFLPWLRTLINQAGRANNIAWIPKPGVAVLGKTLLDFFGNWLILAIFALLLIIFAMRFRRHHGENTAFLMLWVGLAFALVVGFSWAVTPIYHPRYMLFTLPAFYILFALMVSEVVKNRLFRHGLVALVLVASFLTIASQVHEQEKDDWRSAAQYIRENAKPSDMIFISPFYNQDPFTYYYDNECFRELEEYACNYRKNNVLSLGWNATCCDGSTTLTAPDGFDELQDHIGKNIWLVSLRPELYEQGASLFQYFNQSKTLMLSKEFTGGIHVYRFE